FNGGESWSSVYNQPTAEFYHVITDTQTPYRIYGAQQDNTTMTVPSRSAIAGITAADSFAIGGGEAGYVAVRADHPNIVFADYYCTVFAFAESSVERGVLWAGSDDGLVHVSRDEGKTWKNVTPAGIRPFSLVSIIEASPHDAAVAFVATTRYKHDDFSPYLWKTTNYGRTWTKITNGIRADDFTRVIREDPTRKGLLYAGSETGVYVSFDDGGKWHRLGGNLPAVPIHDITVKDSDLVLATHGRSFWLLDDLSPIRQLAASGGVKGKAHLFTPRPTIRFRTDFGFPQPPKIGKNYRMTGATIVTYRQVERKTGEKAQVNIDAGQNPPDGVIVSYWLRDKPEGDVKATFLDAKGKQIRQFTSAPADPKEKKEQKPLTPEQ